MASRKRQRKDARAQAIFYEETRRENLRDSQPLYRRPGGAHNVGCRLTVAGESFPATTKGLAQARVHAKRVARGDRSDIAYGIRLMCGRNYFTRPLEECNRTRCK